MKAIVESFNCVFGLADLLLFVDGKPVPLVVVEEVTEFFAAPLRALPPCDPTDAT